MENFLKLTFMMLKINLKISKMPETKKMRRDTFKCSELASFLQKNQFLSEKNAKNCKINATFYKM